MGRFPPSGLDHSLIAIHWSLHPEVHIAIIIPVAGPFPVLDTSAAREAINMVPEVAAELVDIVVDAFVAEYAI